MGKAVKAVAIFVSLILSIPFFLAYKLESLVAGNEKAFRGASQLFSLFPGLVGAYLRRSFYRLALKRCSKDCHIEFGTVFSHSTVEIGRRVYIGTHCTIGDVTIGDDATIGSNVDIMNGGRQHFCDPALTVQEQGGEYPRVFIGKDAWIGNSAVVMASVGDKAIVGAGSVVVKSVAEAAVVAGNPAALIRMRI